MVIKRVDVEEEQDHLIDWSWENCNGDVEKIILRDKKWVGLYNAAEIHTHIFHYEELKHVIKALQNAEKWFEENV